MRTRAEDADIVIVNHHLFFADLNIRGNEYGRVLPDYSAVIFDEAHLIRRHRRLITSAFKFRLFKLTNSRATPTICRLPTRLRRAKLRNFGAHHRIRRPILDAVCAGTRTGRTFSAAAECVRAESPR
jgi:Rad3-related DNA helicase